MLRCGLLGEKLTHSYSPVIHARLGSYSYSLFEVAKNDVEEFLQTGDFHALNVTIPYKKTALRCCAQLSPLAARIGAVNTVVRRADGTLFGDNTDAYGFGYMLKRAGMDVAAAKVLVLGSGGTSAMAQVVLRELGAAEVVVISRSGDNNYQNVHAKHADAAFIVNATPVGMYPNNGESPLDLRGFSALRGVADVVYNPARTALLLQAEEMGIATAGGLSMLVAQAKRASELFTGETVPDSRIDTVTAQLAAAMQNILLVGMPGSGKSTVAAALAKKLGRELLDSDSEIVRLAGKSIPAIFAEDGEEAFRALETEALCALGKRSGCVIATGGGAVLRQENYPPLHQNGVIFHILRDVSLLPTEGRPLSQKGSLAEMWQQRCPHYRRFADYEIDNNGSVEAAVNAILEKLQ
ncbi:MAG: AAA family ATPase [Oscillospiraceae bacterium]|nr:AAA family ATPase [Oscillospiraceae bacterium]